MNGIHTIFDIRRAHEDDSLPVTAMSATQMSRAAATAPVNAAAKIHASSFLADRGQFGSSLGRLKLGGKR